MLCAYPFCFSQSNMGLERVGIGKNCRQRVDTYRLPPRRDNEHVAERLRKIFNFANVLLKHLAKWSKSHPSHQK